MRIGGIPTGEPIGFYERAENSIFLECNLQTRRITSVYGVPITQRDTIGLLSQPVMYGTSYLDAIIPCKCCVICDKCSKRSTPNFTLEHQPSLKHIGDHRDVWNGCTVLTVQLRSRIKI